MNYLAITQSTAGWLLSKPSLMQALHEVLFEGSSEVDDLKYVEFVEGPVRMAASANGQVIGVWNVDYLSGVGEEQWGFVSLTDAILDNEASPTVEVLERFFYVINQRLQGLLIDGAFIHRAYPNGAHTCMAGRGTQARQLSIGYFESNVDAKAGTHRSVVCVGPAYDFAALSRSAQEKGNGLPELVARANSLIAVGRKKAVADEDLLKTFRQSLAPYSDERERNEYDAVEIATATNAVPERDIFRGAGLTYSDWLQSGSPLTEVQRRILFSDALDRHPLRIVGPGGSGKTLLMQLLALRCLERAKDKGVPARILYVVHNSAMASTVGNRFVILEGALNDLQAEDRVIHVSTLSEYGRTQLGLEYTSVIDRDAQEAKNFQVLEVTNAIRSAMAAMPEIVRKSFLFSEVESHPELVPVLALLVAAEISTAIKGHGLQDDKRRYVQSEKKFSRLHGVLTQDERALVYYAYELYNRAVFETLEVLDTDDIALSLYGRLRTPVWQLKRRDQGYDYVFVDETQLFNENERRVFSFLTNNRTPHVPIALALDEAQEVFGQSSAGMATLGIPDIANESLASIHRSTRSIVKLAFFIIQRSTDLFGPDFPDFTGIAEQMEADTHPLAIEPRIEVPPHDSRLGKFVIKRIREHRKANVRQIAVICHAEQYWDLLVNELSAASLPLHVMAERGERLPADQPLVVLTRPLQAGGQEFDAVILVGLEQGLVPPRVINNDALAAAVEQQTVREIYLAITRARFRLSVVVSPAATPTALIQDAEKAGMITRRNY